MRRRAVWWSVAVVAFVATACGEPAADRFPGPDQLDETGFEVVETITVDDTGFSPDEVTIVAGDGLELVNDGHGPHGFDGGEEFSTGLLEPRELSTLVLAVSGDYPYVDPADPSHEGVIVVEPHPDEPSGDE